jgi:hypothetical protein
LGVNDQVDVDDHDGEDRSVLDEDLSTNHQTAT